MEANEVYLDKDNDAKGPIPCVTMSQKRIEECICYCCTTQHAK